MVIRRRKVMEKVMISKEEAEALEAALEMSSGDRASVSQYHGANGLWDGNRKPLNDVDLETLNIALYVGYEIEPGPEESVLNIYKFYKDNGLAREVIGDVLTALNIQIKGVNS
jgi:hypothetical protein